MSLVEILLTTVFIISNTEGFNLPSSLSGSRAMHPGQTDPSQFSNDFDDIEPVNPPIQMPIQRPPPFNWEDYQMINTPGVADTEGSGRLSQPVESNEQAIFQPFEDEQERIPPPIMDDNFFPSIESGNWDNFFLPILNLSHYENENNFFPPIQPGNGDNLFLPYHSEGMLNGNEATAVAKPFLGKLS